MNRCTAPIAMLLIASALWGCASAPKSRSPAPLSQDSARAELDRLGEHPVAAARPIVILNGYRSPAIFARSLRTDLIGAISHRSDDVLLVAYPFTGEIEEAAAEVVRRVNERWPSSDPGSTVEVDVVGISMGGLVARWAALTPEQRRTARPDSSDLGAPRLRIARLFTFATPHQGARLAFMGLSGAARDMRPGSPFLRALDAADGNRPYPLICYAHLDDSIVGATRAAPPGMVPIWTGGTSLLTHYEAHRDPILVADLARRLRGDPPLLEPGEPPPRD